MQDFALALYVLNVTGSGTKYASILAVTVIPKIILGPILGVLSDSLDKRKIIVSLDILSGLIILSLWRFSLGSIISLEIIYVVVIALSIISSFFNPTMGSVLPLIVRKDQIVEANSINSFLVSSGCVLAPILAGALLDIFGISGILLLNAISFLFSAFTEVFLKIPIIVKEKFKFSLKKYKSDFKEGIKCIKSIDILKYIVISSCIMNLVNNPTLSIGFPYISKKLLGASDAEFGLAGSIVTGASFLSPVIITFISKKVELDRIFLNSIKLFSLIAILYIVNSNSSFLSLFKEKSIIPMIFLCLNSGMLILVTYMNNIAIASIKQKTIPIEIIGRVNGIQTSIAMSMIPVGQMIYGVLFDSTPSFVPFSMTAIILLMLAIILNKKMNLSNGEKKLDYNNI